MNASFTRTVKTAAYSLLMISSLAWGNDRRSDRLLAQSQKLAAVEAQLNDLDFQALERHMAGIDYVLSHYQAAVPVAGAVAQLVCVSNGQPGSGERFNVTDPATGIALGKATAQPTCKQLTTVQNQGLLCVSNGEPGSHERFGLYDLGRKQIKGGYTDLKTCQTLVTSARGPLVCQSNGEFGSHERFALYNRDTDKTLGGGTQLEQCNSSMPH